jgi:tetratricopeptide (TPR) repeat protein
MMKMWIRWAAAVTVLAGAAVTAGAQVPAEARSVDDHSREDALAQQIREAETALEHQDYKMAEVKLKALAEANPKDGRVLYDLGFAEERTGEEADAAKAYAASSAALPEFAEPKVALGLLDARAGRTEAAHKELLNAAKLTTAPPELRGRALRALAKMDETGAPEDAQEELLAALKLTAETPDDVLMGAELADQAGDYAAAETAYKRALILLPGDLDATAGLVHALQKQKKLAEADDVLTAAIKANPHDPRLAVGAATLYASEGKADQAIPLLEEVRKSDPAAAADPATGRLLAHLYSIAGKDAEAEALLSAIVAAQPNDPGLLDDLGSAQVKLGEYPAAEATLSRAFAMRAEFHDDAAWGETATHLAFAASKNKDPKVTLQALAARATVMPNSAASLFLQATAYDTLHQTKEAGQAYRAFLAMAGGKFPDEEFEARHRLVALEHQR